ncbi:MAG: alpha/beta hydrolase [Saprospiraceae bacterium]
MGKTMPYILVLCVFLTACQEPEEPSFQPVEIIRDLNAIVNPNGVQENFQVELGGIPQSIFVRGQDKDNPLLIFVHGGPASPMAPLAWAYQKPLEEYFTVVQYDQRGAGTSYLNNESKDLAGTLTIDQYADDLIQLTQDLCARYKKEKVVLVGHSWGTIVSMTAVLKQPELFYAYVGIGQVIDALENERLGFEYALAEAQKRNDTLALAELEAIAPYPGDGPLSAERVVVARKWPQFYGGLSAFRDNSMYYFKLPYLSPEYSKAEADGIGKGLDFTLPILLPKLFEVDFKPVHVFPIPVFMYMGRHDYTTPSAPTAAWMEQVIAPVKEAVWFDHSAHLIPFEEPGKMFLHLVQTVRPLATGSD